MFSSVLPAALQPPIFRSALMSLGQATAAGDPLAPAEPDAPGEPLPAGEPLAPAEPVGLPPAVAVGVPLPAGAGDLVPPGLGVALVPQAATVSTTAVNNTVHRLIMCPPRRRMGLRGNQNPRRQVFARGPCRGGKERAVAGCNRVARAIGRPCGRLPVAAPRSRRVSCGGR